MTSLTKDSTKPTVGQAPACRALHGITIGSKAGRSLPDATDNFP
jgi:hypothetical protein